MNYNFDLVNYPGAFEFRAGTLKIEWQNGGGTADGAEKADERLRASLYSRLISTAAKKTELDALFKAIESAGFSKEEERALLLKIGARIVEKTVGLPKKEEKEPAPWTLLLKGGFGLESLRDGFEGDVEKLRLDILRMIEAFMVAEFKRREEGSAPRSARS